MDCVCFYCNQPTNGSQVHRSCMSDYVAMSIEDNEVSELFANDSESLPTEDQENEAVSVQRNTPISLQAEELVTFENNLLFEKTYQFETVDTSVDFAFENLTKNFPDEDFDSDPYYKVRVHKYLTSEVGKLEFFIMQNQWENYRICHYPKNIPIRMRKGVHERSGKLWHIGCIDDCSQAYRSAYFTHGILTVEARNSDEFVTMIAENPEYFFCACCEKYLFDTVEHYSGKAFDIPSPRVWPMCTNMKKSTVMINTNEETYATVFVARLIAIVYPQEPPRKKIRLDL